MAIRSTLVNLDAMILREDFAVDDGEAAQFEKVQTISLRDFIKGGLMGPSLRKPDFQRETNHWTPEQVISLLECFVNGDLIPSVILWQSPTNIFVIDGGHRLSVLRAWIEDDYGDGPISQAYFGYEVSSEQKRNATRTRTMIDQRIGKWSHYQRKTEDVKLDQTEKKKINAVITRGLPIQWVNGDADKAEASFFKINTKGTPLDSIEELLLKNRHKPIAISSRAIIRAGKGHRYWSSFDAANIQRIESIATKLHKLLFDPELNSPIKTLDLPLGGSKGVRTAIQALIDLCLIANRDHQGLPKRIDDTHDDLNGQNTINVLNKTLKLAERITGNHAGSLGLHPAVYFYGPSGRHSNAMFMGTMDLFGKKLNNNDGNFFKIFSSSREKLESLLVEKKDLIATILQRNVSPRRVQRYSMLLDDIVKRLAQNMDVTEEHLVSLSGLEGKIVVGTTPTTASEFTDDTKSTAFISTALASAVKCPICKGYLDASKSASYDHIKEKQKGGKGTVDNCQLTHPYCNTAIKNADNSK